MSRDAREKELAEEVASHVRMSARDYMARGENPMDASLSARRDFGNAASVKEEVRSVWSRAWLDTLVRDLVYAVRTLRKSPGFAAVAAISLALGIGGNAAVFSLVNNLLIRPLPYPAPDRLVRITGAYPAAGYALFSERSQSMDVAFAGPPADFNFTGRGEAVRLSGAIVSANLFSVLGTPPASGQDFGPSDQRPGGAPVVLLSDALWKTRFGADRDVIGQMMTIDGTARRIVGVMPPGFAYPSPQVQFWIPERIDPSNQESYWGGLYTPLIGRLRPHAGIGQARNEVRALAAELRSEFPFPMPRNFNGGATVISLQQDMVGSVRTRLLVLLFSVALVLLIACANVASMLLARAVTRRREMALRAEMGAARGRIVRQLLTESVLLSAFGGLLGVLLAGASLSVFRSVLPPDLPGVSAASLSPWVLGFTAALTVLTGIVFGIIPAWSGSRISLADSIRTGAQRWMSPRAAGFRNALVAGEIALTLVLAVAAGLLGATLMRLSQVDPGFRPEHVVTMRISPNQSFCATRAVCVSRYSDLLVRAAAVPGVAAAALANVVPMDDQIGSSLIPIDLQDHPKGPDFPAPMMLARAITPGYLRMMNIPLLAGRTFTDADSADSAPVVLVDASTARRYWPRESAIGKYIKPSSELKWSTVVGVVADVQQLGLDRNLPDWLGGAIYMPYPQAVQSDRRIPAAMNLIVRTSGDPGRTGEAIRELSVARFPDAPVGGVKDLEGMVRDSVSGRRSMMILFAGFAVGAIVLAMVGIYGLVSYSVSQRKFEIGVRLAIGSTRSGVIRLVLQQCSRVTGAGIAIGIVVALFTMRFLSGFLYSVKTTDLPTFGAVAGMLAVAALAAGSLPAWRVAQMNQAKLLRAD
jgi:predicted permease